jgi:hypothetical protein
MNTHIATMKSKLQDKYVVGLIVIVAFISFFLGMEYKAYQFRSAVKDAFSGLQDAFTSSSNMKQDKKQEKPEIKVAKWGSYTYDNGIKLSIDSVQNIGKTLDLGYGTKTATNTFYQITISWENTGKAPAFKSFSSAKLILTDWTVYHADESIQMQWKKEGFGWCVQCEMNPSDKNIEAIAFDINVPSIDGAKLSIDWASFDL